MTTTTSSAPKAGPPKRKRRSPKFSRVQSCDTCRKQKSRCEVLPGDNSDGVRRCHRCTVMGATCSFESQPRTTPSKSADAPLNVTPALQGSATSPPSSESASNSGSSSQLTSPGEIVLQALPLRSSGFASSSSAFNLPSSSRLAQPPSLPPPSALSVRPTAPPFVWQFIPQLVDWSSPIAALQELTKTSSARSSSLVVHDESLGHILVPQEVERLLALFSEHYVPWLNHDLVRDSDAEGSRFLDLVCCTIASRYLDVSSRYLIAPRLQNLTRDKVAEMAFDQTAFQCLEVIQGLTILALWAPICGISAQGDGKMLIGMAATMAMNMRMDEASTQAVNLRNSATSCFPLDLSLYDEAVARARIWVSLANAESLLRLGSGRPSMAKRSPNDMQLFSLASSDTIQGGRDHRIRLLAELFGATEQGLQVPLQNRDGVEKWYDGISACLASLDNLSRLIKPLAVLSQHDKFHFHILQTILMCCRLVVLYQGIRQARVCVSDRYPLNPSGTFSPAWCSEIRARGVIVVRAWGTDIMRTAEAVLTSALQCDPGALATSPDILFSMLGLCGSVIVAGKFFMMRRVGVLMEGSSDALLEQTVRAMESASISEDHTPVRQAGFMQRVLAAWHGADKGALVEEAEMWQLEGGWLVDAEPVSDEFSDELSHTDFGSSGGIRRQDSQTPSPTDDFWSDFLENNPYPFPNYVQT